MNAFTSSHDQPSTTEQSAVEFGVSAEEFPVARVGNRMFAMLPRNDGDYYLAHGLRMDRPIVELTGKDFYGHSGTLIDEAAFRAAVEEQAQHQREEMALDRREERPTAHTPWGSSQGATIYAEGIVFYTTASHGGFHLSPARNGLVDRSLRKSAGFYEEDVEWAIVALTFPHLFTSFERSLADRSVRDWMPDAWEAIFGRQLAPGESRRKDRRAFEAAHAGDWIVISAIASHHHPGTVEVFATRGGRRVDHAEERRFLVSATEYPAPGPFGFVIDTDRHTAYEGPSDFVGWQVRRGQT